jgi:hypothetical protein
MPPQRRLGLRRAEPGRAGEPRPRRPGEERVLKEAHRLVDRLEKAEGLRLERERDAPARLPLDPHEMRGMVDEPRRHRLDRPGGAGERLEGARHGADAAKAALGQKGREVVGRAVGEGEAQVGRPVRLVDLLLHPDAVERAVGEGVDREDVGAVGVEEIREPCERAGCRQRLRRDPREPQPDAEGAVGRHRRLDRGQMPREARLDLLPALARMDVGAVGEVRGSGQRVEPHQASCRRLSQAIASRTPSGSIRLTSAPRPIASSRVTVSSPPRCS